ncbi:MAG TPA: hypothetical protein VHS59_05110 [Bacillota bacterium]|nr:hypothetical protein [Bacillota bacterium]
MARILDQIMDALDVETFIVCSNDEEGRKLMSQLLVDWGFNDVDIVFSQFQGPGSRIRARAYVHRSGDVYGWLKPMDKED